MILIKGKACTGKSTELIRRFFESENAEFISDDMTIDSVIEVGKKNGFEQKGEYKSIRTAPTYDYDFWYYIYNTSHETIFIDIHSKWFTDNLMFYITRLKAIENQIGQKFVLTIQEPRDSDIDKFKIEVL
jgi:hypothetical protein